MDSERTRGLVAARGRAYGTPMRNHARTAALFQAYLAHRENTSVVTPFDIVALNILQKVSRSMNDPLYHDNWLDIQGYAENALMMILPEESSCGQ